MINKIQELKKRVRAWGGGGFFNVFPAVFPTTTNLHICGHAIVHLFE